MSRGIILLLALLVPAAALAQPVAQAGHPAQTADTLLAALQHAGNPSAARALETQIDTLWSRSGSDSADLLLERAEDAADKGDFATAEAILVRLTAAVPNFAEAWHQRAEVAAERENFHDAMASLQRVLMLQPRHFGALSELGAILEEFGDKAHALAAYRKALALDPYLEDVPERIRQLSLDVEGQGI